jgi:hypothetical protein
VVLKGRGHRTNPGHEVIGNTMWEGMQTKPACVTRGGRYGASRAGHDTGTRRPSWELSGERDKRIACEGDSYSASRDATGMQREVAGHVEEEIVMIGFVPCKLSFELHVNG